MKLDFRSKPDGYVAQPHDVEAELERIHYTLKPGDIVLVNTRAGEVFGQPEFIHAGCGMGREATLYLTERGVKIVGTDAWSWDAPFSHTARRWAAKRDPKIIWEGHKAGREIPYWQMEKLTNLAQPSAVRLRSALLSGQDQGSLCRLESRRRHVFRLVDLCLSGKGSLT